MSARVTSIATLDCQGKAEATEDVKMYLVAIYSYADRAVVHRGLTFEKHLLTVMGVRRRRLASRSRRYRVS